MKRLRSPLTSPWMTGVLAICGGLAAPAAHAENQPYYISAQQRFSHTDNVFWARDGSERSDTISTTGVRLGVDQPISRQRLAANLTVNHNRYSNVDFLTHTDYNLFARLGVDTVERVTGNITLNASDKYSSDGSSLASGVRNMQRVEQLSVQAAIGTVTMWTFDAGAAMVRSRYSATAYTVNNTNQTSFNVGAQVEPASGLTLRTGLRHGQVEYPHPTVNNDVRRNDLDFSASLKPTGAVSEYTARVSLTRERHTLASRNLSSWTGALGWNWRPTGKFRTELTLSRDTNNGNYDVSSGLFNLDSAESRLSTRLGLSAYWSATAKIGVGAGYALTRRSLDNVLTIGGTGVTNSATDRQSALWLSVKYAVIRNVDLGCNVSWNERTVSPSTTTLTHPFSVTTYGCYGQALMDF